MADPGGGVPPLRAPLVDQKFLDLMHRANLYVGTPSYGKSWIRPWIEWSFKLWTHVGSSFNDSWCSVRYIKLLWRHIRFSPGEACAEGVKDTPSVRRHQNGVNKRIGDRVQSCQKHTYKKMDKWHNLKFLKFFKKKHQQETASSSLDQKYLYLKSVWML